MAGKESQPPSEAANTQQSSGNAPVSLRSSNLQTLIRQGAAPKAAAFVPRAPGATSGRPKLKASFTFAPNVARTSQPKPKPKAAAATASSGIAVQNLLAHQLAVQGQAPVAARRPPPRFNRIVSASVQNKMAQYENMRNKRRSANKSREILELSWPPPDQGQDISLYTPISLPYVIRGDDAAASSEDPKQTDSSTRKTQRPTIKNVDEANRNATKLFERDDEESDLTDWCLVQLPSLLPSLNKEAMEQQKERVEEALMTAEELEEKQKNRPAERRDTGTRAGALQSKLEERYTPSAFSVLPEGRLGTIQIRRSGKAQLLLGEHVFDVNLGSECNFAQDVGCFTEGSSEFFFLGRCLKKMTITPDIQRIIEKTRVVPQ
eukprot:Protomagalhaensia_wolfi_Nauph_80__4873@NODE_510_length_2409_cov_10_129958_g380_i0_p2_GENE_NODE_510_length_2409_cov_10_129958_g380_i0NODE_510_length_2409_cov_10_129958_g380_i0_p2_ORF_typecomplete_len377_score69_02RNA_pol_Rpc4/PF05132_14/1_5e04RNA_pol_Rpc4/PF05132_14/4_7e02RNA_pol_Rpc4/PF05132_14/1e26PGA2/PF07543_12/1PGA2/PF07543_12/1_9e02_NODE_510_length_2409_cov_10_129958_g380_i0241154